MAWVPAHSPAAHRITSLLAAKQQAAHSRHSYTAHWHGAGPAKLTRPSSAAAQGGCKPVRDGGDSSAASGRPRAHPDRRPATMPLPQCSPCELTDRCENMPQPGGHKHPFRVFCLRLHHNGCHTRTNGRWRDVRTALLGGKRACRRSGYSPARESLHSCVSVYDHECKEGVPAGSLQSPVCAITKHSERAMKQSFRQPFQVFTLRTAGLDMLGYPVATCLG